jgi:hypothetical protein
VGWIVGHNSPNPKNHFPIKDLHGVVAEREGFEPLIADR